MTIKEITNCLEDHAPLHLQEAYDNSGLLTGDNDWQCTGVITTLDVTEEVISEAIAKQANLVVAHHPILFHGLKKISGKNYVERVLIKALKNDIAIYAMHTNLDNIINGVNAGIADKLCLVNRKILSPKPGLLKKLAVFVPVAHKVAVANALFVAGAGSIGRYSECSFTAEGQGSFKAGSGATPFVGEIGERHYEKEEKLEVIFPVWLQSRLMAALKENHPYEEIAYDIYHLDNLYGNAGSGLIGQVENDMHETELLALLKQHFNHHVIRHTAISGKKIHKIAVCGGAGSFLLHDAIRSGADVFITSDLKYHEFFDADNRIMVCDIGHYESEQYTSDLLNELLRRKFPNFAIQKSGVFTNPVRYF